MPPTARSAPRGGRRGLLVLTAGPVRFLLPALPHHPVFASLSERTREGCRPPFGAGGPTERREGQRAMTRAKQNLVARRRDELNRDRGSRRLSQVVDAQRRLNTGRAHTKR